MPPAAGTDGLEPGQAYLCTPGSPFTRTLSPDSSGIPRRSSAPGRRGALPRRTLAHCTRPTTAAEVSEPVTMLVSHRLTRGLCRVSSLRRHLDNWQARVQRVHRAGPSKRTPWLPLPGAARRLGAQSSSSHCSCNRNTHPAPGERRTVDRSGSAPAPARPLLGVFLLASLVESLPLSCHL